MAEGGDDRGVGLDEVGAGQDAGGQGQIGPGGSEVGGIVARGGGDGVGDRHAVAQDVGEDGEAAVLGVEVGGVVGQVDEPLAGGAVGVAAEFGHGDGATEIGAAGLVFHRLVGRDLVEGGIVEEIEAAVLNDEPRDGAVEKIRGVAAGVHVGDEVGHGERGLGVVQGEVDGAGLAGQSHGDARGGAGNVRIAQVVCQRDGGGGLAAR